MVQSVFRLSTFVGFFSRLCFSVFFLLDLVYGGQGLFASESSLFEATSVLCTFLVIKRQQRDDKSRVRSRCGGQNMPKSLHRDWEVYKIWAVVVVNDHQRRERGSIALSPTSVWVSTGGETSRGMLAVEQGACANFSPLSFSL